MKRLLQLASVVLLAVSQAMGQLSGEALDIEKAREILAEAQQYFRQANEARISDPTGARDLYLRAALRFERIAQDGEIHNGKLYYNTANAYFQSGDIGRAILNYRLAERLMPGDSNLAQNLAHARQTRVDSFEDKQETKVLKTLLFWHYDLSPGVRLSLLAIFSALFWAGAVARLLRRNWAPRWLLAAAAGVALLLLGSISVESYASARETPGVILNEQVVARKGDADTYEPAFTEPLHAGTEFALVEDRGDWVQAELNDGRRCWLPTRAVGLVRFQ
jgi:tetratricopeptide (TPR) repeat protein